MRAASKAKVVTKGDNNINVAETGFSTHACVLANVVAENKEAIGAIGVNINDGVSGLSTNACELVMEMSENVSVGG